ncbi:MAG: MFS transporter, partial [Chloroflexi bacterium]|nr:MFS transporter [Chloroflexota bacterium]
IFYGWWVVLAGTAVMTLTGAFSYYGMGVFFNSIREDLGWNAAALGAALSLARVQGGVLAPVVGVLIDRYGSQRLVLAGVLMAGAGFVLLSQTMSIVYFYIVFIFLVQGGVSAGMGNAPTAAVANWFSARRSTALGVMNLGLSLGGILAKPLAEIITAFGWRTAFVVAGATVWVVGIPLAFVIRHRPEDYGYLPDGARPEVAGVAPGEAAVASNGGASAAGAAQPEVTYSPRQALRTQAFWSIALMFSARHFVTGSVALFLIPLLQERGMSLTDAATILSLMAFIGMPGRVGFAWLGDRVDKRAVIGFCFVFQSLGLILFTAIGGTLGVVCFLVLYSPTYSGVLPLIPAIQADYFGREWFATIRGLMAPVATVSVVAGPLVVTAIRDFSGSYEPAFAALAVANILALVFVATTRPPRGQAFATAS